MKNYTFNTKGTCSTQIDFALDEGRLKDVAFTGGCNGNLKAISSLVDGMRAEDVIDRLAGITCGFKKTSCGDQLAQALKAALNE